MVGREHIRKGQNNQDALDWCCLEYATIAVVCDGCGSSSSSEVGAQLGAQITVEAIAHHLLSSSSHSPHSPASDFWPHVQADIMARLQGIVTLLAADHQAKASIVQQHLLFTILGAVITPEAATVFGLGDGLFVLNGQVHTIGPFTNNAPPYLAYGLMHEGKTEFASRDLQLQVHHQCPTAALQSLLLGSDGVEDLRAIAHQTLPGKPDCVGPLSQFWQEDRYFANPDMVRRRLALINREVTTPNWSQQQLTKFGGLLPDDTTLIVMRRRK